MSLQWTFVAFFLYAEICFLILLLLPFISPGRWQRIFKSRIVNRVAQNGNVYFVVFIAILALLFLDAIREVRKYSISDHELDLAANPSADTVIHMKLFRAQRNFYISGFALFLWFVIRRLAVLTSIQATLIAANEASLKQAKSASDAAKRLMDEKDKTKKVEGGDKEEPDKAASDEANKKLKDAKQELEKSREDLRKAQVDLDAMRKQAENINKEYDRLLKEHAQLQAKLEMSEGGKKDD